MPEGRVQRAVTSSVAVGQRLPTPTGRGTFEIARLTGDSLVLLLGEQRAWTALKWDCLEGVPGYLRGRGWVAIGSRYSTDADEGSLDAYLKRCIRRATAGWVAVVLEESGVVEIDRSRPARVRLLD